MPLASSTRKQTEAAEGDEEEEVRVRYQGKQAARVVHITINFESLNCIAAADRSLSLSFPWWR